MTNWQQVKHVAGAAIDLEPSTRDAYIRASCGDDRALYEEVVSLLRAADAAADLYETPAVALPYGAAALEQAMQQPVSAGARIGAYRIVREIGHGGMGSVYLAERADGEFEQQVAIKFVGNRLMPGALVERFRQERRILARLDHPHIARLLDGGTTADGWPYVVMEYVDGLPIDQFCDARSLSIEHRLALFRDVSAAVNYAHQRLVVHRDIKASNILVTPAGTAKLLDFGIATLVEPSSSGEARSETMVRALTPDTASPEQVRGEPVTIAADIYALGVLLYRLLTTRSPYGADLTTDVALIRAICEEEPAPPGVSRDLDLIVLKALRKEPARRYASAAEFSDDLGRYLEGRPVLAAPDSTAYRLQKFIRRHWAATTAATLALVAILAGAGIALYQARLASLARARAEKRFDDVRTLSNAFLFEFHDAIADLPGSLPARQLVVRRAAEYLDALAAEAQEHVPLQRELATANQRLATILGGGGVSSLGNQQGARERYAAALKLREGLVARSDATVDDYESFASLRVDLSRLWAWVGDMPQAEAHATAAIALLQQANVKWPKAERDAQLASAYHQLAYCSGSKTAAIAAYDKAMALVRSRIDANPQDAINIARMARIAPDFANVLLQTGRPTDARDVVRDARGRLGPILAADPINKRYRQYLAFLWGNEAEALIALGEYAGAVEAGTHATAVAHELHLQEPKDLATLLALMNSRCTLGQAWLGAGQPANGIARLRECVADGQRLLALAPTNYYRGELAFRQLQLGRALIDAGKGQHSEEGCAVLRAGVDASAKMAAISAAFALSETALRTYAAKLAACK